MALPQTYQELADLLFQKEEEVEARWLAEFRREQDIWMKRCRKALEDGRQEGLKHTDHDRAMVKVGRELAKTFPTNWTTTPTDYDAETEEALKFLGMAKDFAKIIDAIKEHPMLESEWDRFCMALRMAQE